MNPKVNRSVPESVLRGFPAAFGAESEFRDFVGCSCYGVCGEEGIPIGDQMQLVINVNPETFQNFWPKSDHTSLTKLYWLH